MKNVIFLFRSVNIPFFLDIIERTVAGAFFSFFALRFLEAYLETGHVFLLCQLIAELLVIDFLLVRRFSSQVSLNPVDWCMAVAGTSLPLLVAPGGEPLIPSSLAVSIMLVGLLINFWAKFFLGQVFPSAKLWDCCGQSGRQNERPLQSHPPSDVFRVCGDANRLPFVEPNIP
jgi:hypothetical protein